MSEGLLGLKKELLGIKKPNGPYPNTLTFFASVLDECQKRAAVHKKRAVGPKKRAVGNLTDLTRHRCLAFFRAE